MIKRLFFVFILTASLLFCGCAGEVVGDSSGEDTGAAEYPPTEEELRILSDAYGGSERILEGELYPHQRIGLKQLRAAMEFLGEKYPSYTFRVSFFEPENKLNGKGTVYFEDDDGNRHTLILQTIKGDYECADDYYGEIIRDEYDEFLRLSFQEQGIDALCYTNFSEPVGDRVNENLSVEELRDMNPPVMRTTFIFAYNVRSSETIENVVQEISLYGGYLVYYVSDADGRDVETLRANRAQFKGESFSCSYKE